MKLISWNVNGIRAIAKKGFLEWLDTCGCDIVCLQETKAQEEQLENKLKIFEKYPRVFFNSAERKGYSGVASFFSEAATPLSLEPGFPESPKTKEFNVEGRVIKSIHKLNSANLDFILFNVYFPNGGASEERLDFKLRFYEYFWDYIDELKKENPHIIITGDFNTAHHPIDLARPDENIDVSGFMPKERVYLDKLEEKAFVDSFRHIYPDAPDNYTWWSYRTAARKRNVGWRIDYFYISKSLVPHIKDAQILAQVEGSDHCPVFLEIN